MHSLVICPRILSYRQCLLSSTFKGVAFLLSMRINSTLRASSKIFAQGAFKRVYWWKQGTFASSLDLESCHLLCNFSQPFYHLTRLLLPYVSWNLKFFYTCMNFATFFLRSSKFCTSWMHKLFTNDSGHKVIVIWCIAILVLKFYIFLATFPNLFINARSDSSFSCLTFK